MSGKHNMNLSISRGELNVLPNFQKGGGELDMITIFRRGLLGKTEVRFFRGLQLLRKNKLKSEIFNEKKSY